MQVLTADGETINGFILKEDDDTLSLGVADGKQKDVPIEDIEIRKPMKASSMPEGLLKQIAPSEFLDLMSYLSQQKLIKKKVDKGGWITSETKSDSKPRKYEGLMEISRDAAIKLDGSFSNKNWNDPAHEFLLPTKHNGADFVFHSDHDADHPSVTIRLAREADVRYVWLKNQSLEELSRASRGTHDMDQRRR